MARFLGTPRVWRINIRRSSNKRDRVRTVPMLRIVLVSFCVAIVGTGGPAQAQQGAGIPPQTYLITHLWGSPVAISSDHAAMGGASVADASRDWHANPASLPS